MCTPHQVWFRQAGRPHGCTPGYGGGPCAHLGGEHHSLHTHTWAGTSETLTRQAYGWQVERSCTLVSGVHGVRSPHQLPDFYPRAAVYRDAMCPRLWKTLLCSPPFFSPGRVCLPQLRLKRLDIHVPVPQPAAPMPTPRGSWAGTPPELRRRGASFQSPTEPVFDHSQGVKDPASQA